MLGLQITLVHTMFSNGLQETHSDTQQGSKFYFTSETPKAEIQTMSKLLKLNVQFDINNYFPS